MGWLVQSFAAILWAIACHEITNFSVLCVQLSNCKPSGSKYWHPGDDCRPKNCSSKKWPYRCEIGNYDDNFPNACLDAKKQQVQRKHQHDAGIQDGVAVEESGRHCFAKLARIDLYTYSCLTGVIGEKHTQLDEVSLKFSFHPPSCHDQPVDTAVMAEFNAKNDSRNPYFMLHQICRVFIYSSGEVNKFVFTSSDKGEISYDCIGIGLRYAYPEIYYYLGLTTFPSGALLNYTIVFLDVVSDSMRLVAAAWLSPSQIHVVFGPIVGVANYVLRVTSGDWEISKEASAALPSVEISDISRKVNIVTTFITPADMPVCADMKGCGISITLHRPISFIITDVPRPLPDDVPGPGPPLLILVPCILVAIVIITIACVLLLWRHYQHPASAPKYILLLGPHLSAGGCTIPQTLAREGIRVKTMLKEKKHSEDPSVINDRFSVILIVFSSADFRVERLFTTYMRTIFSNRPMWEKIKIVFQGTETLFPRDLLENMLHIESPKFGEFLDQLSDPDIFYLWPEKKNELIEELKHFSEEGETDNQIDEDAGNAEEEDEDEISLITHLQPVQPLPQLSTAHRGLMEEIHGHYRNGAVPISDDAEPDYATPAESESDLSESQRDLEGYIPSSWSENVQPQFDSRGGFGVVGSIGERRGTRQQPMPASLFSSHHDLPDADDMPVAGHRQDSYASRAQGPYSFHNLPAHAHADSINVNSTLHYVHSGVPGYYTASHSGRGNHIVSLPTVTSQQHVSRAPPSSAVQSISERSPNPLAHAATGTAAVQMDVNLAGYREPTQNSYHSVNSDSGIEGPSEFRSASHVSQPHLPMLNEIIVHLPPLLNNPSAEGAVDAAIAWRDVGEEAQGRNAGREQDDVVWRRFPENNVAAAGEHYWGPNQESNDSGVRSFSSDEANEPGH